MSSANAALSEDPDPDTGPSTSAHSAASVLRAKARISAAWICPSSFREAPEATSTYAVKKDLKFLWPSDPKGAMWKTFDSTAMPTNILIDKGGRVVKVVPGCTMDGKNAQILSHEIAQLLKTDEAVIVEPKK